MSIVTIGKGNHKRAATNLELAILTEIKLRGKAGGTVRELTDTMDYPQVSISPEMVVLERNGLLVRTGAKRKHPKTGARGIVWVSPEHADPAPKELYLQWDQRHWATEVDSRADWSLKRKHDTDIRYVRA